MKSLRYKFIIRTIIQIMWSVGCSNCHLQVPFSIINLEPNLIHSIRLLLDGSNKNPNMQAKTVAAMLTIITAT